jgi:hypothetical protein
MTTNENAIKTQFSNEQDKALANILYSGNFIKQLLVNLTRPFNLKTIDYHILQILKEGQGIPLTFESVKNRLIDAKLLQFKHFDKLEELELVEKVEDSLRSLFSFRITEKGLLMISEIEEKTIDYMEPLKNRLNSQEARILNYILDKLRG